MAAKPRPVLLEWGQTPGPSESKLCKELDSKQESGCNTCFSSETLAPKGTLNIIYFRLLTLQAQKLESRGKSRIQKAQARSLGNLERAWQGQRVGFGR